MGVICSESTLPFAWLGRFAPLLIQEHLLSARLCGALGNQSLGDTVVPAFEKSAEGQCTEQVWSALCSLCRAMACMAHRIDLAMLLPAIRADFLLSCWNLSLSSPPHDSQGLRSLYLVLSAPALVLYPFLLLCGGHGRL